MMVAKWFDAGDVSSKGKEMFRKAYKTEGLVFLFQVLKSQLWEKASVYNITSQAFG